MTRKSLLGLFAMLLLIIAACDRKERTQGGVSETPVSDLPKSAVEPSVITVSALSNVSEVAPKSGNGPDAQEIYSRTCNACHQANGQGVPGAFPPLDGSPYVLSNNVERMASIMIYGLMGPIKVKGNVYAVGMTPQGAILSNEELAAVATHVRSSWSNKASAVEPAVFEKMRQKWGTRGQFTIQELGEEPE